MSSITTATRKRVEAGIAKDSVGDDLFRMILRMKRAEYDETQAEFAQRLGISVTALRNWEENPSILTLKRLRNACRRLNVPAEEVDRIINI